MLRVCHRSQQCDKLTGSACLPHLSQTTDKFNDVCNFVPNLSEIRLCVICHKCVTTKKEAWTVSDWSDKMRSHIAIMFCPKGLTLLAPWVLDLSENRALNPPSPGPREFVPKIWQTSAL